MLRPGLHILRRDRHTVQLGLEWPGVASVRETPAVAAVLDCIDGFRDAAGVISAAAARGPEGRDCERALSQLIECGAVVDEQTAGSRAVDEQTWAAWSLLAGPQGGAADVSRRRGSCTVHVAGDATVAEEVRRMLADTHVAVTNASGEATLIVLASDREPPRTLADRVMHTGLPHLWVYVRDLVGVVGPLVVPGRTACLRCVDRARAELDPAWPTLVEASAVRPLLVPACDLVLARLVAAWAAHEVALWASGIAPQTQGCVVELPHGCGQVQSEMFAPHPYCGCGWPVWQDTMGA